MPEKRKNCIACNNKLTGRRLTYCSNTCYRTRLSEIAHAKIHERRKKIENNSCEICSKIYKPLRSVQTCCSEECREIKKTLYLTSRRKKIKQINCNVCNKVFKPRNYLHLNCSPECRKIDYRQKEQNTIRIRPSRRVKSISKYKSMPFQLTIYSPDKILLRQELEEATAKYLKKNKITKLPDSPAVKVPSVGMTSLKIFGDEREFYEEAALGHLDMNLLEMDTV
jgi:hypothetical protein